MQQETSGGRKSGWFRRAADAIRGNRKLEIAVYGGILLVVAVLYAVSLQPAGKASEASQTGAEKQAAADSELDVEARLSGVLSSIRGAGRVEVMITYETGTELVTAMSTKVDSNTAETSDGSKNSMTVQTNEVSEPATVGSGGGNEPIVLMEKQPVVRGVIVVAEGAADIRVKLDLQRAVQAVLDVPLSKIEVFELSSATAADARE